MKGSLLNGFKVWIQDGRGLPLSAPYGRVKFYKANTSEPLEVYSSSAMDIPLGTTIYTDINGYLPDVWLRSDFLYDVVVEKKIGEDPETWVKLFDVEDVGEIIVEKIDTPITSTTIVSNIAELRDVDYTLFGIVYVLGYYNPGDTGEPMTFKYDADLRKVEDGGSIILPNDKLVTDDGRWTQVFNESVIDVRKFGALPDTGSDLTAKIVNAITYCRDTSKYYRPLTVAFLKPGQYSIRGNFDMDQYRYPADGKTEFMHYVINDGVVFNGLGSPKTLTIGRNTEVLSNVRLVSGEYSLKVPDEFKGFVRPCWFKDMSEYGLDSEISDAIVLGEDGMFLEATDCIIIYKDMHKVDLWGSKVEKIEGSTNGLSLKIGTTEAARLEKGLDVYFNLKGKAFVNGVRDYIGTRVQNVNGGEFSDVEPGRIAVNDDEGSETVITPMKVTTKDVESSGKVTTESLKTNKFAYLKYKDITGHVVTPSASAVYEILLRDYVDEEPGFRVTLYSRAAGRFGFDTIYDASNTKSGTVYVNIKRFMGIEFVKVGNLENFNTGDTYPTWIMLDNTGIPGD